MLHKICFGTYATQNVLLKPYANHTHTHTYICRQQYPVDTSEILHFINIVVI